MNTRAVREALSAVHDCAIRMLENASFILQELPNVEMREALRSRTTEVCESMVGTKHDVISELLEINELIQSRTDAAEVSPRIDRVIRWLRKDISDMHQVVLALREDCQKNENHTLATILVEESAANILYAFNLARSAAETLAGGKDGRRDT